MLLVPTEVKPSEIHGLGLFATEFIRKGTIVQKFCEPFDTKFKPRDLNDLYGMALDYFLDHAYGIENGRGGYKYWVLCGDNARFLNHSDTPNLVDCPDFYESDMAARDIKPGEELTVNYYDFDADAYWKLH